MKWNEATALRLCYFLVFCCTAAWLPVMADYLRDQGMSPLRVSFLLALTPALMLLFQPVYGVLADRWGYRRALQFSCLLAAISFSAYLLQGGFVYLLLITTAMSVFYNGLQPLLDSLSLQLAARDPKFSYGKLRIAGAAGWAFTGIITGQLIDAISTTVIFSVAAVSLLLAFLVSSFIQTGGKAATGEEKPKLRHISQLLSMRNLWSLLLGVVLISAGTSPIWYFYSTYLKEMGASAGWVGIALSFQGLCELPLFYFSAAIIARLGYRRTLFLTIGCTILRLFLYSVVSQPYAVLPIELLHGFSWSLFWVVCVELVNQWVEPQYRATGQSLLYAAYFGAGVISGNFWTGYLAEAEFSMTHVFLLNAGIVVIIGFFLLLMLRRADFRKPFT